MNRLNLSIASTAIIGTFAFSAFATDQVKDKPTWWYKDIVGAEYVKKLIDKNSGAVIVDARPARKFKKGHVPTAINIPLRQFDK
ncbi:MAG: rhodanese-like domain-containing protein [Gammaproteobacteria bacterium]|nr:rhodanese-like domain-containing protein [Gammaproteobacteria bacterium]